jgi:hypothetical protein
MPHVPWLGSIRTLALVVGLLGAPVAAVADVVQVDLRALFNADVVLNDGTGVLDPTQQPIDQGLVASGNFCFMTRSVAEATAVAPQTPDGLPDDAFFAAGAFHPDVQLAWDNADDGLNAWRLQDATATLRIDLPPDAYLEAHVFATAGNGPCDMTLTPLYTDGPGVPTAFAVPDWYDDPPPSVDLYHLVDARDRMQPGSGPGTAFLYEDGDDAAIFGFRIVTDPARLLEAVSLERTDVSGVLNVFGAVAVTDDPPEACCLPDGSCFDVRPNDCLGRGGIPQGAGTDCAGTACPQPQPEACCFRDGTCDDLLPPDCAAAGGTAQGAGTDCAGATCPADEACCLRDGSCQDLAPGSCALLSGFAQGPGTACATTTCPQREACCFPDGTCVERLPQDCANQGGAAQGAGSSCASLPCGSPALPGWTPNGAARTGDPLTVRKAGASDLALAWGLGCSPDATDYTVHEGAIGDWYGHQAVLCDTAGLLTSATIAPAAGGRYLLVVPVTDGEEGSYGLDSNGAERPASASAACRPAQVLGCP